jgi:hypothetical protein
MSAQRIDLIPPDQTRGRRQTSEPAVTRHLRTLRNGIVVATIAVVATGGISAASARPEPEQPGQATSTSNAYSADLPAILRSNVLVDAYVHERFFYGAQVGMLATFTAASRDAGTAERHLDEHFAL